jgi:NAD(P)-dependent dehydrogenase (short-subunit alcohol dehydrogenase family)
MDRELNGKIALITGGGKGIGRAAVDCFLREGASVCVADWSAGKDIPALPESVFYCRADISKTADCESAVREAVNRFGGLDILVNNAGVQTYGDAVTTDEGTWDYTMDVNLRGQWLMAHAAIPEMLKRGKGSIVNVSSVQGLASQRNVLAYSTSKHGMIGLTRTMAVDFAARGIRVNCVCPGTIDTPMVQATIAQDHNPDRLRKTLAGMHPLRRIGQPAEIGEVITFLASDRASFMTGSIVVVDGGLITPLAGSPE